MRVYVISDSAGEVMGVIPAGADETTLGRGPWPEEQSEQLVSSELVPQALPGQRVDEVEVPEELEALSSTLELHQTLRDYRVKSGNGGETKLVRRSAPRQTG